LTRNIPESIARTVEEFRWLRTLTVGLWLLILSSAGALQIALIMPMGRISAAGINYFGPKVFASAAIQFAIGGQPGPDGVFGTMCLMASAVAIYLLTEPRIAEDRHEHTFSLRRLTRWVGLLSIGGFCGLLLAGFDGEIPYTSWLSLNLYFFGILCCELPTNTLLYLHLRRLGRYLGNRRAVLGLNIAAMGVPLLMLASLPAIVIGGQEIKNLSLVWRMSMFVLVSASFAISAIGLTSVCRLALATTLAAFAEWLLWSSARIHQIPVLLRAAVRHIDRQWPRWCAVIGLLLWLSTLPLCMENAIGFRTRTSFGGSVPFLNYAGPKVSTTDLTGIAAMRLRSDDPYEFSHLQETSSADLISLLAIWLLTFPMPGRDTAPVIRKLARYLTLLIVAVSLGLMLAAARVNSMGYSYIAAWAVFTAEVPATFLVYLHLAHLARDTGLPDVAARLIRLAFANVVIAIAPFACLAFSTPLRHWRHSWVAGLFGAAYVTVSLACSLLACCAFARLTWQIAAQRWLVDEQGAIPAALSPKLSA
jgi:hypothetical protein